ncbi:hypothetical protein QJS10_CPA05g00856 [Acorus calamus]|uniref:Fungal lipase-type domain-containing protein n=1 Tax=Acorus calamus TaxID=4465 RepID=A0AAV9EW99_ACOCL|nr:hypothetical protein QJS10_CPA05g00856 [Acorus calamus]
MSTLLPKPSILILQTPLHTRRSAITSLTPFNSTRQRSKRLPSLIVNARLQSQTKEEGSSLPSMLTDLKNDKPTQTNHSLVDSWREIHGSTDWAGILDPIDPLLRSELIRYGEMVQACYDSFDFDPCSKYCGSSKYSRRHFFEELGMSGCGYEVTRYLYATSNLDMPNFFKKSRGEKVWSKSANWMGYIAVSNDETSARLGRRDVVVAWRGTVTGLEWVADLMDFLKPVTSEGIPCPDPDVKIESGFLDLYGEKDATCRFSKYSAREQVLTEVKRLVELYAKESGEEVSISIMGHSLGSALAMVSAYDIAETGVRGDCPVCVFSFAGPRVGNWKFKERFEKELGLKALRVVNVHDKVPQVPGMIFNERVPQAVRRFVDGLPWSYSHVGVELELNHKKSPFLKETVDVSCYHNMEAHLHLLDGYHGKGERFVLASGRDPALVNKSSDFLKDDYLVPPNWRQDENKGMIRDDEGRWTQPERAKPDDHPPHTNYHLQQLGLGSN